ncbi:ankyrin repeat domain-containing protein SOWAHA [Sebastes fasciatus]|uniref:ankyrin repeat domain-containing protein SOWAHA n=1 Tax=Sebastes fasciatus TaxID=394691 RepID=UPI003D9E349F
MSLTQESVLSVLLAEGGKVKKSDLVGKFKASVDCDDPAEKERNRELFKTFVNNVAFVKEIEGVRYVVVRKAYQHVVVDGGHETVEKTGNTQTGEQQQQQQHSPELTGSSGGGGGDDDAGGQRSADPDQEHTESSENPTLSPIQLALQRSKYKEGSVKRAMTFDIRNGDTCSRNEPASKPYALPLRMPPSTATTTTRVELCKLKVDPDDPPPESPNSFRNKRRPPCSVEASSPQLRRSVKSTKAASEASTSSSSSSYSVPLEQSEHEWLVKCAAGHWSQAYGLLLRDNQLAEKRDFMSGFTALHWAAKCGNGDMLVKIIDLSRQGGVDIDVNAKTHGGYTPLHIAALHDQEGIVALLVGEHGADPSVRDNGGKKAYHYMREGVSETLREMLGEPKAREVQEDRVLEEKEELDLLPDLSKGLYSISRLFQPHVAGKSKKHKQRPAFYSLSDDPVEEQEDNSSSFRHRVLSDIFM